MEDLILEAKELFFKMIDDFGKDPYGLRDHLFEVERWAKFILSKYPQLDEEVLLLSIWFHDLGHYPIPTEIDHSVRGVERARVFFESKNYPLEKMERVLHCIRAHRCKDVLPETFEAKAVAFIDSASHITDTSLYFRMAKEDKLNGNPIKVYEKIDRDLRDLFFFPEIQKDLEKVVVSWKDLIKKYEELDFV